MKDVKSPSETEVKMAQRYIYLDDKLNQKLKKEENASALIRDVLNQHYNSLQGIEVKNLEQRQIEVVELQKTIKEKEREVEEIKTKEMIEEITAEEQAAIKARRDAQTERLRNSILQELNNNESQSKAM